MRREFVPALLLACATAPAVASTGLEPELGRLEALVHAAATELPWRFDEEAARLEANALGKPLVVYVRQIGDPLGRARGQGRLALPEVSLDDDGYARDVLFRAAVLSQEDVAALLARRCVPCVRTVAPDDARALAPPALVVYRPEGGELARRDRFGTLCAEEVDAFLRGLVADARAPLAGRDAEALYRDGELELLLEVTRYDGRGDTRLWRSRALARLGDDEAAERELAGLGGAGVLAQRARLATRRGDWPAAATLWQDARRLARGELHDEAAFGAAWALARQGEPVAAAALWYATAADATPVGRRAAACLLDAGPRLALAASLRAFRADDGYLDPQRSLEALLDLQQPDGSFTAVGGFEGDAWSAPAITALALEALRAWQADAPVELHGRVLDGADAARLYLVDWALRDDPPRGLDAFNEPRVLRALLGEGERAAAQTLVRRMARHQLAAGGWSAYGDGWPISFLTAEGVLAWLDAKAAGLAVPTYELERALGTLELLRLPDGGFHYGFGPGRAWTTPVGGSIARDPLCELALLRGGRGSFAALDDALRDYLRHAHELAGPLRRLDAEFDVRGHASYHFFYGHDGAVAAARFADEALRARVVETALREVAASGQGDGTFLDHWRLGRAYATAMALRLAAAR
ncbi:MAG: hypothetical protein H6828_12765 [Planctomycetes bacterium]|nr:hypothetical protein [Planctomycetota bacterium]